MNSPNPIISHGITEIEFDNIDDFIKFFNDNYLEFPTYIFRGQQHEDWVIESSLIRNLKKFRTSNYNVLAKQHLNNFKYAIRDRIKILNKSISSLNDKDKDKDKDNELWSLGQQYGLATPLIDWTYSPFIAAFFAFEKSDIKPIQSEFRLIYALHKHDVENKVSNILKENKKNTPIIEFIKPIEYYNSRLINQRGLHVKISFRTDVETWIKDNYFYEPPKNGAILTKFKIKNSERSKVLKVLSRMNINHLNLYPDLEGSSKYCNMSVEIYNYSYNT